MFSERGEVHGRPFRTRYVPARGRCKPIVVCTLYNAKNRKKNNNRPVLKWHYSTYPPLSFTQLKKTGGRVSGELSLRCNIPRDTFAPLALLSFSSKFPTGFLYNQLPWSSWLIVYTFTWLTFRFRPQISQWCGFSATVLENVLGVRFGATIFFEMNNVYDNHHQGVYTIRGDMCYVSGFRFVYF